MHNKTRDAPERLGHLELLQGKTQTPVPEIKAGDLGAVAKLKDTLTNDTLGDKADPIAFPRITFPEPVLSYAIEPKSRGDEDKISTSMHRLEEEDPSIRYSRDPQTKELLLSGQGQLHIEVTVAKLKRRFGVDVNLKPPRIPYRETIKASTEAHGRHKKQTGGHGQFGDCKIKVEPLPRGADFEFVDDIFGGSIPRQFIPAVEKGIQDARTRGYLAGYPMVDFRVTVFDGSYHDVDSNELSFKLAGSLAFKDAMTRARPTILEPVMNVEVYAPSDFAGDLMGDLNGRRGRIGGMDTRGATTIIKAQVPMAEMLTYEQHLTSATGGRGLVPHGVLALRRGAGAPAGEDHRRGEGRARRGRGRGKLAPLHRTFLSEGHGDDQNEPGQRDPASRRLGSACGGPELPPLRNARSRARPAQLRLGLAGDGYHGRPAGVSDRRRSTLGQSNAACRADRSAACGVEI